MSWGCNIMADVPTEATRLLTVSERGACLRGVSTGKSHDFNHYDLPLRDFDDEPTATVDCPTTGMITAVGESTKTTDDTTVNSALEATQDGLLSDGGAAYPTCPKDYAPQFETRNDQATMDELYRLNLRVAEGTPLKIYGMKRVDYMGDCNGAPYRFSVDYIVTNTVFPIVSETILLRENKLLLTADDTTRKIVSKNGDYELPLQQHGNLWWIMPQYFDTTEALGVPTWTLHKSYFVGS